MAFYDGLFDSLGLRDWCDADTTDGPMSMAQLLARSRGDDAASDAVGLPFPSLDLLHQSCAEIPQSREMTAWLERSFLDARSGLKFVLDPLTQPLSWLLDWTLWAFTSMPWWILIPGIVLICWWVSKSKGVTVFVALSFLFLGFIDHLDVAVQTLSIISSVPGSAFSSGFPSASPCPSPTGCSGRSCRCSTCCRRFRPSST